MRKVFLYLYPISEYTNMYLFRNDENYDNWNIKRPLPILNETIDKRYRQKGYEILYVLYPDRTIFGLDRKENDKIILTDITFKEATGYKEDGSKKSEDELMYPSEQYLINQLGNVDNVVVGGYHAYDCVKRVAEALYNNGIPTLIDLDLTDLFFQLYGKDNYFIIDEYDPIRFINYMKENYLDNGYPIDGIKQLFRDLYSSDIYKMDIESLSYGIKKE